MKKYSIYLVFLLFVLLNSWGCASQIILNDKQPSPEKVESTPPIPRDDFEERLKSVQTGGFEYIMAFRLKDNGVFTSEDKRYIKENIPADANQKQLTSDEKAVIIGSNYPFTPQNIDALKKRFKIEDYSSTIEPKQEQKSNVGR